MSPKTDLLFTDSMSLTTIGRVSSVLTKQQINSDFFKKITVRAEGHFKLISYVKQLCAIWDRNPSNNSKEVVNSQYQVLAVFGQYVLENEPEKAEMVSAESYWNMIKQFLGSLWSGMQLEDTWFLQGVVIYHT